MGREKNDIQIAKTLNNMKEHAGENIARRYLEDGRRNNSDLGTFEFYEELYEKKIENPHVYEIVKGLVLINAESSGFSEDIKSYHNIIFDIPIEASPLRPENKQVLAFVGQDIYDIIDNNQELIMAEI